MGGGNGAKAAQKRARNAKDAAPKAASQLKTNKQAMSIICDKCKQTFLSTSRAPQLTLHAVNKHSSDIKTCFPNFEATA
ncbi:At2g23090 like protein [Podospora australis]|uniref:At2g23090 like protein n=1 Tax=Podospora australis TaxID=1536484 RepID=A0AAN6X407_9PEZI|nr:At2g23090 like protein [Podospora australis]